MKPPKKKRNKIIELGSGPSLVRIYTINRSDGYPQHTVAWKEGGRRKTRVFANLDEDRLIARQQVVRLTNVVEGAGEVTLRDVEVFQFVDLAERLAQIEVHPSVRAPLPTVRKSTGTSDRSTRAVIHAGNGLTWRQVTIEIAGNQTIQLTAPGQDGTHTFSRRAKLSVSAPRSTRSPAGHRGDR